ncbi:MAG: pyridoxal-phosphate dependent enzyme [Gemmatimonadales bacterium]
MSLPLIALLPRPPLWRSLGKFPSPVQLLPDLARQIGAHSLSVKREDLNGTPFGGNKLRALEWLLPTAGRSIASLGGFGSTWCAALATAARVTGREAHLALFPQPWTDTVAGALNTTLANGHVHLARTPACLPFAVIRAWFAARTQGIPTFFGPGGAAPLGVLGSVNAALELASQIDAGELPRPDAIVVPLGSGGTAAGLLLGCQIARLPLTICAVRVASPFFASERRVRGLAGRTRRLLRRCGLDLPALEAPLIVIKHHLGAGYGHPTAGASAALARLSLDGITTDLTYTAKAAAALGDLAASFPHLCLWHTFDPRLAPPLVAEHSLLRRARAYSESLWPLPKLI